MLDEPQEFNRGAIRPMQCMREGWQLIKEQYWLFVGILFVGGLIAGLGPMGILLGPMMCGFFICMFRRESGQDADFNMLFKGFDYFLPGLVPSLLMTIPVFVMIMGALVVYFVLLFGAAAGQMQQQQAGGPPDPFFVLGPMAIYFTMLIVIILISQVINAFFIFAFPLIAERRMSGWDAVKLSFRAVLGNLGGVIGLFLLLLLLKLASLMLCFIGEILEAPLQLAMLAVAYRQVFPRRHALVGLDRDLEEEGDDRKAAPDAGETPGSTGIQSEDPGRVP